MSGSADDAVLDVRSLVARFDTEQGSLTAVDGISFSVTRGTRFGIVGESGSGKSVTALAILGLIDPPGQVTAERIGFKGRDLSRLPPAELRRVRGRDIGLVLQDPLASLSPVFTVGEQIAETIRLHENVPRRSARARAVELLDSVGIPDPAARAREYPHRLSGGMRQRAAIAIALACEPELLIADEPTTALDVTIQAQVIELLTGLCEERDMAIVLITHDLGLLAGFADRVAVMYAGRIVESGPIEAMYGDPHHPYTEALLASQPQLVRGGARRRLPVIPGAPPALGARPQGCAFHPRCSRWREREPCVTSDPRLRIVEGGRTRVACHFAEEHVAAATPTGSS